MVNRTCQLISNKLLRKLFGYDEICENVNGTRYGKNCLLLYITKPFRSRKSFHAHQNQWQVRELARIVGEFGYNVDVVDFSARKVRFGHRYDMVIDLHPQTDAVYRNHLADGCLRIAYLTGSNPRFANHAEQERCSDLEKRRGVAVQPRRQSQLFDVPLLDDFDGVMFIGNEYNLKTYAEFDFKQVHLIRNTGYDFLLAGEVTPKAPSGFLYIANSGQVHKGLDLLLEVFRDLPDLKLHVCGRYLEETDFFDAYREELTGTHSIVPCGFLDINGEHFRNVLAECSYVLMPSCSEGLCGSVLTAMSAGLVPIVSRECGFDDDEVIPLPDCRIETIRRYVLEYADKSPEWVAAAGARVKAIVRNRYGADAYRESVRAALRAICGHTEA